MMIVLIAPVYDGAGNVRIHALADSGLDALSRRVTRRATIDGGAWIDDFGFSDGDRTFSVKAHLDVKSFEQVRGYVRAYDRLLLCTADGVFRGAIEDVSRRDVAEFNFLVEERVDG